MCSLKLEFDRGASTTIQIDLSPKAYTLKPKP